MSEKNRFPLSMSDVSDDVKSVLAPRLMAVRVLVDTLREDAAGKGIGYDDDERAEILDAIEQQAYDMYTGLLDSHKKSVER